MASADGGEQQAAGSLLPGGEQPGEMPESFCIGTDRAYQRGYAYPYKKQHIDMETVYVCNRGSDTARDGEFLVLRQEPDAWVAYNSSLVGNKLRMRQGAFRCTDDITKAGYHSWQMNKTATAEQEFDDPVWSDFMWCRTEVPKTESSG